MTSSRFPFRARCIAARRSSPVPQGEVVEVTGMAPEEDCEHDMLVDVQWQGRRLAAGITGSPGAMSFRFWNERVLEAPTTDDALVVARALRLEGNREATQE